MENASKALIIAGAVLISILLISVTILIFNSTSGVTDSAGETEFAMMIASAKENAKIILGTIDTEDNESFEQYVISKYGIAKGNTKGRELTVPEVIELCTLVTERNMQELGYQGNNGVMHIALNSSSKAYFDIHGQKKLNFDQLEKDKTYQAVIKIEKIKKIKILEYNSD